MLLAQLLGQSGIDVILLEARSRDHVLSRIRAGLLEQGTVEVLREANLAARLDVAGMEHDGVTLAFGDQTLRIDLNALCGRLVTVYGQTEITRDLLAALDESGAHMLHEVDQVQLHDLEAERPAITFEHEGVKRRIECDYIAGCDGYHGVSRPSIPSHVRSEFERLYPFGWLGILSNTSPLADELVYAHSEAGFALCSMRSDTLSRHYVQCSLTDSVDDWSDDRFWDTLSARLPTQLQDQLETGPSIEKSIAPLRSFVSEPMRYGRLCLAGDAAHIVPPTGAKGLNLAVSDVVYLSRALKEWYADGDAELLDSYSATCLRRVWKAVRFSWWMTALMHQFDDGPFGTRIQLAELDLLSESVAARTAMAENYTGLPF